MPEIASARLSIDLSLLPVDADKRVLDVGCGDGRHVVEAARRGALLGAVPSHFTEMLFWKLSRGYREAPGGHVRIYRPGDLARKLRTAGLSMCDLRYVHFVDSLFWLRFCLTDFLRPTRAATAFE